MAKKIIILEPGLKAKITVRTYKNLDFPDGKRRDVVWMIDALTGVQSAAGDEQTCFDQLRKVLKDKAGAEL